jgi:hypothetical protein
MIGAVSVATALHSDLPLFDGGTIGRIDFHVKKILA